MKTFLNFDDYAAARGDGLIPALRLLLEKAASERRGILTVRSDGAIQAGPDPASEANSRDAISLSMAGKFGVVSRRRFGS